MNLFRRRRPAPKQPAPETDFSRALKAYFALVRAQDRLVNYPDVVSDYGKLMVRNADRVGPFPASQLPYPKELIVAALYAGFTNPRGEAASEQLITGMIDLERYVPDEELTPYVKALAAQELTMSTMGSEAFRRLMAADAEGAVRAIGGLPKADENALHRLERVQRKRRAARWVDLVEHAPGSFDLDYREGIFLRWMHEQALDAFMVATGAVRNLEQLGERGTEAAEEFTRDMAELRALVREADDYPAPPSQEERARWYHSVLFHIADRLREISLAVVERRLSDATAANDVLAKMMQVVKDLADNHQALIDEVVKQAIARHAAEVKDPGHLAPKRGAPREPVPADQKGFLEDLDDGGDG